MQCVGEWGHTWPLETSQPLAFAQIAIEFFEAHSRVRGACSSMFAQAAKEHGEAEQSQHRDDNYGTEQAVHV